MITNVEPATVIESLIAVVFTALLGFIVSTLTKVRDTQSTQGTDIAVIKNDMGHVSRTVTSLHEWRNRLQVSELEDLKRQLNDRHKEE